MVYYYKVFLLQSAKSVITKVLQSVTILSQRATGITKCDDYDKERQKNLAFQQVRMI